MRGWYETDESTISREAQPASPDDFVTRREYVRKLFRFISDSGNRFQAISESMGIVALPSWLEEDRSKEPERTNALINDSLKDIGGIPLELEDDDSGDSQMAIMVGCGGYDVDSEHWNMKVVKEGARKPTTIPFHNVVFTEDLVEL